jgi:DNA-directed RNA polymerase specialized sigma24 family protein
VFTQDIARKAPTGAGAAAAREVCGPVQAAETVLRRFGARAISILTSPRQLEDGRWIPARLSANDCYVALEESCHKMARVALRKYAADQNLRDESFSAALDAIFPDPAAYLTRCIRSVISDAERLNRREVPTVSLEQPIGGGDTTLSLRDTIADTDTSARPEESLIDRDERLRFRNALARALKSIPANYLEAIERDIARERERENGAKVVPESARERQTVCRARAALSTILKRECGPDNPFINLLAQQRSSRVRHKSTPSQNWSSERQQSLFRRLMSTSWTDRAAAAAHPEENIEEAVVNEVTAGAGSAPPSPEMRQSMRVLDLFVLDNDPRSEDSAAQSYYDQALKHRKSGRIEEAMRLYGAAYEADPTFLAAHNEVGVLLMQTGNLRDALKVYLSVVDRPDAGEQKYIAANNAADVYLTWFDAGRNKERNIERATHFARMAMEHPTPMRACNLLLAYVKDRYYIEAQQVMNSILQAGLPSCPAERFLQTLFQIRDADLVAWLNWLDSELDQASPRENH